MYNFLIILVCELLCRGELNIKLIQTNAKLLVSYVNRKLFVEGFLQTRRFGRPTAALLLAPAESWGPPLAPPAQKKSKMAVMVPKWLPVVDMGEISLSSEFQPCSSSND